MPSCTDQEGLPPIRPLLPTTLHHHFGGRASHWPNTFVTAEEHDRTLISREGDWLATTLVHRREGHFRTSPPIGRERGRHVAAGSYVAGRPLVAAPSHSRSCQQGLGDHVGPARLRQARLLIRPALPHQVGRVSCSDRQKKPPSTHGVGSCGPS